jgi:hypothetical protein
MKLPGIYRLILTGTIFLLFVTFIINCNKSGEIRNQEGKDVHDKNVNVSAEYTGRESCRECHEKQYNLFLGSDHDMAMDVATDSTVLGNFNNVTFTQGGITSRFFRKDGKFLVNTEGPDGDLHDYEIRYVFGIRPLQQYLVEFPGGR